MNIEEILKRMTLKDKIRLCSGADIWHTKAMDQYGISAIMMADGPHGVRKQTSSTDILGINQAEPATCFPTAVTTGCSWDTALLEEIGAALGQEAKAAGISVLLGPGANLKRDPLCGRNFEYFSEDPLLTGKLAAAHIRGLQETGVSACLKHFACNSQEYKRFSSNSILDERTLRELYLTGFEIAVREGTPASVMSAYNKVLGSHCSDNKYLLTDFLRNEWGFEGTVITDWGGLHDRIKAFRAGCDLNMPGGSDYQEKEALQAVNSGDLSEAEIDNSVRRILRLVEKGLKAASEKCNAEYEAHDALACRAAEEGAVLMKNEGQLLPLSKEQRIVFIGHMAKELRYQGSGSSRINPWKLTSPMDACPDIPFVEGCLENGDTTDALIQEAIAAAKQAETAVVFAGLTEQYESEGFDRNSMEMPAGHNRLIEAVSSVNSNTVVVLLCGSPVEMPWHDRVKSMLYMGLPGQAGGTAVKRLLFGDAVPCGKLTESWPVSYEDCPTSGYYAHGKKDAHYREGLYVGYRYYSSAGKPVRYPFGHGLSYSAFEYSDIQMRENTVECTVKNTGAYPAKEIVQLYITPPEGPFYRPKLELKDFCKVSLSPGESKRVCFRLSERSFAVWNNGWVVPGGSYTVKIGSSSRVLPLQISVERPGTELTAPNVPAWYFSPAGKPTHEDFEGLIGHPVTEKPLKRGEFSMENTVMEMKDYSRIMKLLYVVVRFVVGRGYDGPKDETDATFSMMMHTAVDASLSGMKINARMKNHIMEGLLDMANGLILRGLIRMLH